MEKIFKLEIKQKATYWWIGVGEINHGCQKEGLKNGKWGSTISTGMGQAFYGCRYTVFIVIKRQYLDTNMGRLVISKVERWKTCWFLYEMFSSENCGVAFRRTEERKEWCEKYKLSSVVFCFSQKYSSVEAQDQGLGFIRISTLPHKSSYKKERFLRCTQNFTKVRE